MTTVAILGLGQIGGSLAAALTARKLARVIGITRRPETARRAKAMGLLAYAGTDLAALAQGDIVVMATPVRTLLRQIPDVASRIRSDALLTDVGSTKTEILTALHAARPAGPVLAGHPMAGNERAGLDGVDPDLFVNRPWVLIPARPEDRRAAATFERLLKGLGAIPRWMSDPLVHDLQVARVSHLPYLLSYALMGTPEDAIQVCGNSFRDATRVAASDVDMVADFLLTNREPIRKSAGELEARLCALVSAIVKGDERALRKALTAARNRRQRI